MHHPPVPYENEEKQQTRGREVVKFYTPSKKDQDT
jgi:hypothetical protein